MAKKLQFKVKQINILYLKVWCELHPSHMEQMISINVLTLLGQSQKFEVDPHTNIRDVITLILAKHQGLQSIDLVNLDLIYCGKLLRYDVSIGEYLEGKGPHELYIFPREKVIHEKHLSLQFEEKKKSPESPESSSGYGKMKEPNLSFLKVGLGSSGGINTYPDGIISKFHVFILQQFQKQLTRTDEYVIGMCVINHILISQPTQTLSSIEIVTNYGTRLQWFYEIPTIDPNKLYDLFMQNIIKYPQNFIGYIKMGNHILPNQSIDILSSLCKYDINGLPISMGYVSSTRDEFFPTTLYRMANVIVALNEAQHVVSGLTTENRKVFRYLANGSPIYEPEKSEVKPKILRFNLGQPIYDGDVPRKPIGYNSQGLPIYP